MTQKVLKNLEEPETILITGAAGFIGSSFARLAHSAGRHVIVLDALTYAANLESLKELAGKARFSFHEGRIENQELVQGLFEQYQPTAIVHFAAESHVDNSISGPKPFLDTNVFGTYSLLEAARIFWTSQNELKQKAFRFIHVSTDEVFGALGPEGKFSEVTPYAPNSPYSASKAASDHFVRAWHHTYGIPTIITNCSNNYGPRQHPEKLIPRMIHCALNGESLPVYGKGQNVRDWIHVDDHVQGVWLALTKGRPGSSYCFGGSSERENLTVVNEICKHLDRNAPRADGKSHSTGITFVTDRLGHDFRYAIDDSKSQSELGFTRKFKNFEDGLSHTIDWYLANPSWVNSSLGIESKD